MCRISGGVSCLPALPLPLPLLLLLMDRSCDLGDEEEYVVRNSDWNAGRDDKTGSTDTKADPRQAKAETMASLCAMLLPALISIISIIMLLHNIWNDALLSAIVVEERSSILYDLYRGRKKKRRTV